MQKVYVSYANGTNPSLPLGLVCATCIADVAQTPHSPNVSMLELDKTSVDLIADKVDAAKFYVSDGELLARPDCPVVVSKTTATADDVDACVLSECPEGCKIFIDEVEYAAEDGTLELTSAQPELFNVQIFAWPYKDLAFNLTFE